MLVPIAVHDPLPLFRRGVVDTLRGAGFDASSPGDLVAWAQKGSGRVVLVTLGSREDWLLLRRLRGQGDGVAVLALLDTTDVPTLAQAVRAGADGTLERSCPPQVLCDAVQRVCDGRGSVPVPVLRALAGAEAAQVHGTGGPPTEGELTWLRELSRGATVRQLAERTGYSERTMYRLLHGLYGRLAVGTRTEALMTAHDRGWI